MYGGADRDPHTVLEFEEKAAPFAGYESMGVSDQDVLAHVREIELEQLRDAEAKKPTPLEDTWTYALLQNLSARLMNALDKTNWSLHQLPVFGTLPLGELNAMAIRVPQSTDYLIAFQHGVFGFANLLTKAFAASLPEPDSKREGYVGFTYEIEKVEEGWNLVDEPLRRLVDFLGGYLVSGHPHAAEQYYLGQPAAIWASILREAFELFIFGHELGHIVAGHLDRDLVAKVTVGEIDIEQLNPDWRMEFEADAIGARLTMIAMRDMEMDETVAFGGIDLFFSAIELVDRALSTLVFGEVREAAVSHSHPPAAQRRKALREGVRRLADQKRAAEILSFAVASERILDLMWSRVQPSFQRAHAKGVKPAPSWATAP